MKVSTLKRALTLSLSMALSPAISFLLAFLYFTQRTPYAIFFISLFFSLLAYSMVPYETMDLAGHYNSFDIISTQGVTTITEEGGERYELLYYFMYFLSSLGVGRQALPLLFVFTIYMLTLKALDVCLKYSQANIKSTILFQFITGIFLFFVLSQMRLIPYASGLRSALANAISLYAIIRIFLSCNNKYFIFLFLAPLVHISTLPYVIFTFFCRVINERWIKYLSVTFLFISGFFIIFRSGSELIQDLFVIISPMLPENIRFIFDIYTSGYWGADFKNNVSNVTYIYELVLKPSPIYVMYIYIVFSNHYSRLRLLSLFILFFVSVFIEFRTIVDRYGDFLLQLMLFNFLLEFKNIKLSKSHTLQSIVVLVLCLLYVIIDVAGARVFREVIISSWHTTPFISIFLYPFIDINNSDFIR